MTGSADDLPRAVVGLVYKDGRFLVIKRGEAVDDGGVWAPPSGKVASGETDRDAVVRELQEELGIRVQPVAPVWSCVSSNGRFTLAWWLVHASTTTLRPDPREVACARWCTPEIILGLSPIFDQDKVFFEEVWPSLTDFH